MLYIHLLHLNCLFRQGLKLRKGKINCFIITNTRHQKNWVLLHGRITVFQNFQPPCKNLGQPHQNKELPFHRVVAFKVSAPETWCLDVQQRTIEAGSSRQSFSFDFQGSAWFSPRQFSHVRHHASCSLCMRFLWTYRSQQPQQLHEDSGNRPRLSFQFFPLLPAMLVLLSPYQELLVNPTLRNPAHTVFFFYKLATTEL